MADTFLANVTLGRDVSEAQVWQALETVQLADLARGLSDGLHTHLGEQEIRCPSGKNSYWRWRACWLTPRKY